MKLVHFFFLVVICSCQQKKVKTESEETSSIKYSEESKILMEFKNHIFTCDSGLTTIETNICSEEKAAYADSLLDDLFQKIISSLSEEINQDSIRNRNANNLKDKEDIKYYLKNINDIKRKRKAAMESQEVWLNLRELNTNIYRISCEGGTACNAIINTAILEETLERIKLLESFFYIEN